MSPEIFRDVMGCFATGVAVIAGGKESPVGMTVNSFTSVSLDPPLVLWCARKESEKGRHLIDGQKHSINFLHADQKDISSECAGRQAVSEDRFACPEHGAFVLQEALASLQCTVEDVMEGGDHWIILSRVLDAQVDEPNKPLIFYQGGYKGLSCSA